uniref:Uncharacterized protein n=2 Tax=Zea mays TaxID=4577 RepID=A0A804Q587_MAIZE
MEPSINALLCSAINARLPIAEGGRGSAPSTLAIGPVRDISTAIMEGCRGRHQRHPPHAVDGARRQNRAPPPHAESPSAINALLHQRALTEPRPLSHTESPSAINALLHPLPFLHRPRQPLSTYDYKWGGLQLIPTSLPQDTDSIIDPQAADSTKANKGAACYKTKVVKNWDAIYTIYSKDHANGEGAKTGTESGQDVVNDSPTNANENSLVLAPKKQRTGDAIMGVLTDMKASFQEAMQSNAPLELPKKTAPSKILAALQEIPDLPREDMLRSYGMLLSRDDRIFEALMELPMEMRKDWLLFENERK